VSSRISEKPNPNLVIADRVGGEFIQGDTTLAGSESVAIVAIAVEDRLDFALE